MYDMEIGVFDRKELEKNKIDNVKAMSQDVKLKNMALDLVTLSNEYDAAYQWTWLGQPIIQLPPDILAVQEIIWKNKPDLIIETGVAWGGSIVFYASILELIGKGKVIAIDLNLHDHITREVMNCSFSSRVHLYQGSSTDKCNFEKIKSHITHDQSVMVLLDSDHSEKHVLDELRLYAPLVTKEQYLIVSDTIIEDLPAPKHRQRSWGKGNNPKTALEIYLKESDRFVVDEHINSKLITTFTPGGYLRCVK